MHSSQNAIWKFLIKDLEQFPPLHYYFIPVLSFNFQLTLKQKFPLSLALSKQIKFDSWFVLQRFSISLVFFFVDIYTFQYKYCLMIREPYARYVEWEAIETKSWWKKRLIIMIN